MIDLSKCTDNELRNELQKRGYCTTVLWTDVDVQNHLKEINEEEGTSLELTQEECMDVLNDAVGSFSDMSKVDDEIKAVIRYFFALD